MTPRLPLLAREEAPPASRSWYREDGSASPLTRSLATAPDLLETLMPFLAQIMGESSLDGATKELVIARVSQLNGCEYCIAAHREGVRAPHDERERAILDWVDRVTLDARAVDDELAARALEHVREDELVELTLLAGATGMLNRYCTAFDIPPPR